MLHDMFQTHKAFRYWEEDFENKPYIFRVAILKCDPNTQDKLSFPYAQRLHIKFALFG